MLIESSCLKTLWDPLYRRPFFDDILNSLRCPGMRSWWVDIASLLVPQQAPAAAVPILLNLLCCCSIATYIDFLPPTPFGLADVMLFLDYRWLLQESLHEIDELRNSSGFWWILYRWLGGIGSWTTCFHHFSWSQALHPASGSSSSTRAPQYHSDGNHNYPTVPPSSSSPPPPSPPPPYHHHHHHRHHHHHHPHYPHHRHHPHHPHHPNQPRHPNHAHHHQSHPHQH